MSLLKGKYLKITIGDVEVDVSRSSSTAGSNLLSVIHTAEKSAVAAGKSDDSLLSANLLGGLTGISLKDIKVAKSGKAKIVTAGFNAEIDLAKLPLIGEALSKILQVGIDDFQVIYSTDAIGTQGAQALQNILPPEADTFPSSIPKGLRLLSSFNLGNDKHVLQSSSKPKQPTSPANDASPSSTTSSKAQAGPAAPAKIGKKIGPVHLQSVTMNFHDGELTFAINASVAFGPLVMDFQGLQVSTPFNQFDPSFDLHGLGINYQSGPVAIGGGFLHDTSNGRDEYSGMVTMKLEQVQLEAFGSYAKVDGDTSLFIYALLSYPLGGPPFLYVTGLAAAFGYNRDLIAPSVSQVSSYPLVKVANSTTKPTGSAASQTEAMLQELDAYIPPKAGEYFIGLGLKFTSFKVVNSFALLIGKFGRQLEFDFFGFSRYVSPAPSDPAPVAVVELELLGRFAPEEGNALIEGQLTPHSFVFNRACHLTGGFAYAFWTSGPHAGDFVISYGGYGSHFTPPAHYPQNIPTLGLNWQVSNELSVKGGMYWALTPQLITAGGFLHAVFQSGCFRAWFDLDAYFLIKWKPFHYEAGFSVDFGLSVHIHLLFISFTLHVDVSADLKITGPPFSGTASIDLDVCTVHVSFGAGPSLPLPLAWSQFSQSFLPAADKMVNINCVSGLVKTVTDQDNNEVWVINPKEFCMTTNSIIPSTEYSSGDISYEEADSTKPKIPIPTDSPSFTKPGIHPMQIDSGSDAFTSKHVITITGPGDVCQLKSKGLYQNVPKAIWGGTTDSDPETTIVTNTLHGFQFEPGVPPTAGTTHSVPRQTLAWDLTELDGSFQWSDLGNFASETASIQDNRSSILDELGLSNVLDLSTSPDPGVYHFEPSNGTLTK